jgi:diguanylate cyclase (GGDEF)-like protein/PAS domain S-box-containing protein
MDKQKVRPKDEILTEAPGVPRLSSFLLIYCIGTLILAFFPLKWPGQLFLMLFALGPILYAVFHYPARVYISMIFLAVLLEILDIYLRAPNISDALLLLLLVVVPVGLVSKMGYDLQQRQLRAEQALQQSEERYRSFVTRFQGIAYRETLDLTPVFLHGDIEKMTGYLQEDFMTGAINWHRLILPEDQKWVNRTVQAVRSIPSFSGELEYRILRQDGEVRWVHEMVHNISNSAGEPVYIQGAVLDITARKQMEEALLDSEQRYRSLFESVQEGFALFHAVLDESGRAVDFRLLEANPAFERTFQALPNPLTGRAAGEFFPAINQEWIDVFKEVLETGQPRRLDTFSQDLQKHFEVLFFRPRSGQVATISTDITSRKLVEMALNESQAHFHSLFENSPVSLWEEDFSGVKRLVDGLKAHGVYDLRAYFREHPDARIVFAEGVIVRDINQATVRLMGENTREELLEHIPAIFRSALSNGISEGMIEQFAAVAEGKTDFEWEGPNGLVNGEVRYHHITWAVMPGSEHMYERVIVAINDITDSKRAEETLMYLSSHDTLTGLFNRAYFDAELNRLRGSRLYPITIFFADMDGMKAINDNQGHAVGDDLLRQAAALLQSAFRAEDIVARIGGDEFGVLLPDADTHAAQEALQRIYKATTIYNRENISPPVLFSIGFATAEKGEDLRETLRRADENMYHDKVQRKQTR